jgi:hypothetical protein
LRFFLRKLKRPKHAGSGPAALEKEAMGLYFSRGKITTHIDLFFKL